MKITHYCNSFICAEFLNSKIACDPWLGTVDDNAWISYPIEDEDVLNKIDPNYIYISHLHPDHLDPKTLAKFKNKNVQVIIKNFTDGRLKNKIIKLGFKNILECEPWREYSINNDFSVVVIPQMSSNTDSLPEDINYDLDTSILIISKNDKKIFYNNTDNPVSESDIQKVKDFVKNELNSNINVACFPVGASSEYPQCFLGIDKNKEKKRILEKSHTYLKKILNVLEPDLFFPAGGTYVIYGKFAKLNKFVGLPNLIETSETVEKDLKIKSCVIEGGKSILLNNGVWKLINKEENIGTYKSQEDCINKKSKIPYHYEKNSNANDLNFLDDSFNKAKQNYLEILKKKRINIDWEIKFNIYKSITLNENGDLTEDSTLLKKYEINSKSSSQELSCHMDLALFKNLLSRKTIWNVALSGSLILFERKPNKFIPNVPFSLNYLAC